MTSKSNNFEELYRVDVGGHVEKKNGFSYVSWPFAVAELRKRYPSATWEVVRFDGKPFMQTECGYFVEVAVTVEGVTLSQIHPVLNHANKPIAQPTAFDINSSIQRCLVKAIALHGLGLYVYAGEDLPPDVKAEQEVEAKAPAPKVSAKQVKELDLLIADTETDSEKFRRFFKVETLADLPAADFDRAKRMLEKKKQEAQA